MIPTREQCLEWGRLAGVLPKHVQGPYVQTRHMKRKEEAVEALCILVWNEAVEEMLKMVKDRKIPEEDYHSALVQNALDVEKFGTMKSRQRRVRFINFKGLFKNESTD